MRLSESEYAFTSESVSEGHPDKICDRISDAILDAYLRKPPNARVARVACECLVTKNFVVLAGETDSPEKVSREQQEEIARNVIREIGYAQENFHWEKVTIKNLLHDQSKEIGESVRQGGAGDQGLMFGYAVKETPELMPAPIYYANTILRKIKEATPPEIGPDGKIQLSVIYRNGQPQRIGTIVLSYQHHEGLDPQKDVRKLLEPIVQDTLPKGWLDDTCWLVNPSGSFIRGGPDSDTGLTGRKIIVDTYGGSAPHGGGAFSGKDPTKVDRSGAYAARYIAKNIVAAGLSRQCKIQISYAIGKPEPVSIMVDTGQTDSKIDRRLEKALCEGKVMDLTPQGIRDRLGLCNPIYERTAAYGHFGRAPEDGGGFSWERIDPNLRHQLLDLGS